MKLIISVYSHPEYYPPTLNAIHELSTFCDEVYILSRNVRVSTWNYPKNVKLITSGSFVSIEESQNKSSFWKLISFFQFTFKTYLLLKKYNPKWILTYDPIPLLAYRLSSFFLKKKPKIWYHNHDMLDVKYVRKYSISWFAYLNEKRYLPSIHLFSLPSPSRIRFYPINKFKGMHVLLPNVPSINYAKHLNLDYKEISHGPLKLIYQGRITRGHGLKKVIESLKENKDIQLTCIGPSDEIYKKELEELIKTYVLTDRVKILEPVPYEQLKAITVQHHVGLAILEPVNIHYETASFASNKIFEYMAVGMPVILFKSDEYLQHLGKYQWTLFTDLTMTSFVEIYKKIKENYKEMSKNACHSFSEELNFEHYFKEVKSTLIR